ncbi:DNA glycosylase AlkZ-like family protein [uncultured Streptomyces sp.]|uniref:DNA glycosylase AlkZ-like family protein n=1 Tax=uncultured Streptomyces sp. TaxID=174707 RepID=UPI00260E4071|nr:crosslink repair DNA glycosylase YcaQ family protein [uncultured Streptomyces sp.]
MNGTERIRVTRAQVLAHRAAAHGLDRSTPAPAVLALGVQDTPAGSAALALAARGASAEGLERVWSFRGAPHLHRREDLAALATALWPADDADATARLSSTVIKEGARLGVEAFRAAALALRTVVTGPTPKGVASAGVTALVPRSLAFDCATCGSRHVSGLLFQQAGLFGAVRVTAAGGTTLAPLDPGFPLPTAAHGTADLVEDHLRFLGPATPAGIAKSLGVRTPVVDAARPADLTEVDVDGTTAWARTADVDALRAARPSRAAADVRLLPPGDPYLQARDRELLVPDAARRKEVWRAIGNPGVLLLGSEPAGTWRAKAAGRRVDLTVTPFVPLPAAARRALEAEADLVARTRGASEARLLLP